MDAFVILSLLSLLTLGGTIWYMPTLSTIMVPSITNMALYTPIDYTPLNVTQPGTLNNTCTGMESLSLLDTIIKKVDPNPGNIVHTNFSLTASGTQKILCYSITDLYTGADASTFVLTGGEIGTNTLTITGSSAIGKPITAAVNFFGK